MFDNNLQTTSGDEEESTVQNSLSEFHFLYPQCRDLNPSNPNLSSNSQTEVISPPNQSIPLLLSLRSLILQGFKPPFTSQLIDILNQSNLKDGAKTKSEVTNPLNQSISPLFPWANSGSKSPLIFPPSGNLTLKLGQPSQREVDDTKRSEILTAFFRWAMVEKRQRPLSPHIRSILLKPRAVKPKQSVIPTFAKPSKKINFVSTQKSEMQCCREAILHERLKKFHPAFCHRDVGGSSEACFCDSQEWKQEKVIQSSLQDRLYERRPCYRSR